MKDTHPESINPVRANNAPIESGQVAWQLPSGEELAQFALRSGFMASCLMLGVRTSGSGGPAPVIAKAEPAPKERPAR